MAEMPDNVTDRTAGPWGWISSLADAAFPSAPGAGLSRVLGILGLSMLALSLASSRAGQNIAVAFMLLGLLPNARRAWADLWPDPVFRLILLWVAYVVVRAVVAAVQMPELAGAQIGSLGFYARLLYIPLVGWWLGRSPVSVKALGLLVLIGLLVGVGINLDWQHPIAFLQLGPGHLGGRKGFGMNPEHTSLVSVLVLAGMIAYAREWIGPGGQPRGLWVLRALAWVVVTALVFQVLIVSQTRAAWLAGLIVGLSAAGVYAWRGLRAEPPRRRRTLAVLGIAVLGLGLVLTVNSSSVVKRMTQDAGTYREIVHGRFNQIQNMDVGARVYLWRWAIRKWRQRPVFGWGPGSRRSMISNSNLPKFIREHLGHVHNSYLEVAFALGLVGVTLYLLVWGLLLRRLWHGMRSKQLPSPPGGLLLAAVALFALASGAEAYVVVEIGWTLTALLGGAMFAVRGARRDAPRATRV